MSKKSFVAAMLCAAVVTGANASAAFAGEVTGNGSPPLQLVTVQRPTFATGGEDQHSGSDQLVHRPHPRDGLKRSSEW